MAEASGKEEGRRGRSQAGEEERRILEELFLEACKTGQVDVVRFCINNRSVSLMRHNAQL